MNFGEFKALVRSWLNQDTSTLPDNVLDSVVNICRREILRKCDLRYGEASATVQTSAGTTDYSLPTGWSRPHTVWYLTSEGAFRPVYYLTKEEFDRRFPDPTGNPGAPGYYTVWGGQVSFGPTPDSVYNIKFTYYRFLPDLSGDSDTDDLLDTAWEALLFYCLWYLCFYFFNDNRADRFRQLALEHVGDLGREYRRSASAARRPVSREVT